MKIGAWAPANPTCTSWGARLTPSNCDSLLFDDVLWVQNATRDHFDFMTKMRDRGVEVVELHNVLAQTSE